VKICKSKKANVDSICADYIIMSKIGYLHEQDSTIPSSIICHSVPVMSRSFNRLEWVLNSLEHTLNRVFSIISTLSTTYSNHVC